jgi:dihydroflavonol-4-reductase
MKVLLTGGTGFLGSWIARQLVKAGYSLRILVRKTSKLDVLKDLDYEKFEGDILDRKSVAMAVEGVEAVIHTAGNVSIKPRDRASIYNVNVQGTQNVLSAAYEKGIRVIQTSTCATIGATLEPILQNENSMWTIGGKGYHYIDSKRQGEEIALQFANIGLDIVILNPGWILGPGDISLTSTRYILEYCSGRIRYYFRGGMAYCDVRDVAKAHITALEKGKKGNRYIIAGHNYTYRHILETLYQITGLYKPRYLPYGFSYTLGCISEVLSVTCKHPFEEFNRAVVYMGKLFFYFDISKAKNELDYIPRPFNETLKDTIKDFLTRGLVYASTPELKNLKK